MSSYYSSLQDALYLATRNSLNDLGYTESDVIVRFSNQDSLAPNKTYCIITVLNIIQVGSQTESPYVPRGISRPEVEFVVTYKVDIQYSIIGAASGDVATEMKQSFKNNRQCFYRFKEQNLGTLSTTMLRYAPQKWDTQWVDGFNFDSTLSYAVRTLQDYDWVDKVVVTGNGQTTYIQ